MNSVYSIKCIWASGKSAACRSQSPIRWVPGKTKSTSLDYFKLKKPALFSRSSIGLYRKSDIKELMRVASVRHLSSLLGLAALACLSSLETPWKWNPQQTWAKCSFLQPTITGHPLQLFTLPEWSLEVWPRNSLADVLRLLYMFLQV